MTCKGGDGKYDSSDEKFLKPENEDGIPCHSEGGMSGLMSYNGEENPLTYNWNKIFVGYCDGASFAGNLIKTPYDQIIVQHSLIKTPYDQIIVQHTLMFFE